jgi:hypothetical protein
MSLASEQPRTPSIEEVCHEILASEHDLIELSEFSAQYFSNLTGQSALMAAEWADENRDRLLRSIEKARNHRIRRGEPAPCEVAKSGADTFVRLLDIQTVSGTTQPRHALRHATELLSNLDDDEFEALGALLLASYQQSPPRNIASFKTRRGNDGGFDFGGWWSSGVAERLAGEFDCRIAGQAKNWSGRIGKDQIELFASRLSDLRLGYSSPGGFPENWLTARELPILGLFLARAGFQGSCHALASAHWISLVDVGQAAADLVRSDIVSTNTTSSSLRHKLSPYLR